MSFFIYVREENFRLAEREQEEVEKTHRDVSFFVCAVLGGKKNKADSAQWETFHVYREESRIRHKLRAGMR